MLVTALYHAKCEQLRKSYRMPDGLVTGRTAWVNDGGTVDPNPLVPKAGPLDVGLL